MKPNWDEVNRIVNEAAKRVREHAIADFHRPNALLSLLDPAHQLDRARDIDAQHEGFVFTGRKP